MNVTTPIQEEAADFLPNQRYVDGEILYWALITICVLMCILGMIGNGLVIYVANRKPTIEAFRHLNKVVRNLAATDFLFCVLGAPLILTYWTWSKILLIFIILMFGTLGQVYLNLCNIAYFLSVTIQIGMEK